MSDALNNRFLNNILRLKLVPKLISLLGLVQLLKLILRFKGSKNALIKLKLEHYNHAVYLRANTTDLKIFLQIFVQEEYSIDIPLEVKAIIDAGSNCGYSVVYFANRFKNAKIIAIEPDASNVEMIKMNTQNYSNIEIIEGGLWDKTTYLKIINKDAGNWAFRVDEVTKDDGEIKGYGLDDLMNNYNLVFIDILKIDIEGSENTVFLNNYNNWLSKTKFGFLEVHENYAEGVTQLINARLKEFDFEITQSGENIVFIKNH